MSQKMGILIGEITRIKRLTIGDETTFTQYNLLLKEITLIGYLPTHLRAAFDRRYRCTGDDFWLRAISATCTNTMSPA